jgi:hypothetical protein
VIERLRTETFVLVAGESRVGKSSQCRAVVLPQVQGGAGRPPPLGLRVVAARATPAERAGVGAGPRGAGPPRRC